MFFQSSHGKHLDPQASTAFWVDLKIRTFLPSSTLKPTRSALLVSGLKIATLETWMGASFSTIPPCTPAMGFGLVWRLIMLTPVTTRRLSARRSEERRVGKECRSRWAADQ